MENRRRKAIAFIRKPTHIPNMHFLPNPLFRWAFPAFLLFLAALPLAASLKPDTSVRSYTLRKFDEEGVRVWNLSGKQALFVSDNIIRLIDIQLGIESGREGTGPTVLRSSGARIHVDDSFAEGEGFLFVEGNGYTLQGDDWSWDGRENRVRIRTRPRVTFDEAIEQILD